ncbi:unnamed protein product [Phytomonas sp. EM1]|nr:unnamed protein product [Phytomonas sp. EM1]|eukprot:CCW61147.1 unnamed protein product [Phytomonas sp. isolate EM1]
MYRFLTFPVCTPVVRGSLVGRSTVVSYQRRANHDPPPPSSASERPVGRPKAIRVDRDAGISKGLGGFGHYAGSITAFMKSEVEKKGARDPNEPLPCSVAGSQASLQAMQAKLVEEAVLTGTLPSPRRPRVQNALGLASPLQKNAKPPLPSPKRSSLPRRAVAEEGKRPGKMESPANSKPPATTDAEEYYRALAGNQFTKEELWQRVKQASVESKRRSSGPNSGAAEAVPFVLDAQEADYVRMEEELKEVDPLHFTLGELAFPEESIRRNYLAMWYLAISLNKARWSALEVQSQRGVKSTGVGMKLMFWKEAVSSIVQRREMISGQFTDSHPVLRPFGATVAAVPGMTKAFIRGFTDARLRVMQQPGNVKQLFDHFDKFYGYFFFSLMEVIGVKDEHAEHLMQHVGRAIGLVLHCVMLWKRYVRLGVTMLPADLCADNHVNLALLKNLPLASRDGGVRKLLYDVLCIAKTEMLSAQKLASAVPPKVWPIVMECLYPNYYLGYLQRKNFNVSAMFADYNIENPGFVWFRLKKRWEWERYQSMERLLDEAAPLPWINTSILHSPSKYKMAPKSGEVKK